MKVGKYQVEVTVVIDVEVYDETVTRAEITRDIKEMSCGNSSSGGGRMIKQRKSKNIKYSKVK